MNRYKALRTFSTPKLGNVRCGEFLLLHETTAKPLIFHNLIVEADYQPPKSSGVPDGAGASLLPAGQVSPQSSVNTLADSEKLEDARLSQSTAASEQSSSVMQSMPATEHGGKNTQKKQKAKLKKDGQQTGGQQNITD